MDGADAQPAREDAAHAEGDGAVRLDRAVVRRAARFAAHLSAAAAREDSGGRNALGGASEEFVGHRPYRPGEDLRHLDWALLGRLEQPFVKVHRASRREAWVVAIDASPSMAVGAPSKLQSAAEAALGAIALGLRVGARVEVVVPDGAGGELRGGELGGRGGLARAVRALDGIAPRTDGGLERILDGGALLARAARARARRVVLIGDFLDVDLHALLTVGSGRRRVHLGRVVAPEEADPSERRVGGRVSRWYDPEAPDRPARQPSTADLRRYDEGLDAFAERLARAARQHRMSLAVWSSADPFENHVPDLLQ